MDLQLVHHAGLERPLPGVRAAHQHVPVPGRCFRSKHRALDPTSVTYVTGRRIEADPDDLGRVFRVP